MLRTPDSTSTLMPSMKGYRKFWFGLAMGLPYLLIGYHLGLSAISYGRDLTATGLLIGAIATGVVGICSAFVWGNVKETVEP